MKDFFQYRETIAEAKKTIPEWNSEIEEYDSYWEDYSDSLAVNRDLDDEEAEETATEHFDEHFKSAKKKGKVGKYTIRSVKVFDTLAAWGDSEKYMIFITKGNKLSSRDCYVTGSNKDLSSADLASIEQEMNKQRIK